MLMPRAAERDLVVVDALVGVAGDEQVVGLLGVGHGAQHLPVGGAEVLGLVDDDVLIAVMRGSACRSCRLGG